MSPHRRARRPTRRGLSSWIWKHKSCLLKKHVKLRWGYQKISYIYTIYHVSSSSHHAVNVRCLLQRPWPLSTWAAAWPCSIFTGRQGGCRIILPARQHSNAAGTHVFLPFRMNTLKQWISAGRVYYNYIPHAPHCQPFQTHPHPMCTCPALKC